MSHHFRNLLIKLSLFTVVAVIVTVSVIASLLDLKLGQPSRDYHAVFTDSPFELIQAEGQHRDHAIVEQVFADVTDGPLAHMPSGSFAASQV